MAIEKILRVHNLLSQGKKRTTYYFLSLHEYEVTGCVGSLGKFGSQAISL